MVAVELTLRPLGGWTWRVMIIAKGLYIYALELHVRALSAIV